MTDDGKVDYKIEQSKSQYVVNSLESFFEESMDSVTLAFCINKRKNLIALRLIPLKPRASSPIKLI